MTNHILKRCLALLGALAAAGAVVSAQEVSTNLVSETTFDPAAPSPWGYTYFYSDNGLGYANYEREHYLLEDFEMTNAMWRFSFDLSSLSGMTGYGTGTGGPLHLVDPAGFISTNRGDYEVSFDARVEGLVEGQTSANAEMQVQFYYPGETDPVKSLQINLPFQPTSDWQTFTFNLADGAFGDGTSAAMFAEHGLATSELRFNVNFHEPHNAFGYEWVGDENALYLDNMIVEVIDRPTETSEPKVGVTMAEWNFDDQTVDYEYHYQWSQNEYQPVVTAGNNAGGTNPNDLGVEGTSGWWLTMDTTEFFWNPPQWAGGGTGGGGPVDYTLFDSPEFDDYRVTFDARVEGLAAGQESTSAVLQLFVDAPDDTVTPADENTDGDTLARIDFPISQVGTEWKTYSSTFTEASVGSGSRANFASFHDLINALRTQWQLENIAAQGTWEYDANNTLVIDNFKLERLVPAGLGEITATVEGDQLVLTWDAPADSGVKLQSATEVEGPYTDVEGATSGYSTDMTGEARFFRLIQEATI